MTKSVGSKGILFKLYMEQLSGRVLETGRVFDRASSDRAQDVDSGSFPSVEDRLSVRWRFAVRTLRGILSNEGSDLARMYFVGVETSSCRPLCTSPPHHCPPARATGGTVTPTPRRLSYSSSRLVSAQSQLPSHTQTHTLAFVLAHPSGCHQRLPYRRATPQHVAIDVMRQRWQRRGWEMGAPHPRYR